MKKLTITTGVVLLLTMVSFAAQMEVISYAGWEASADGIGSAGTVTIDSTAEGVINKVDATLNRVAHTIPDSTYDAYISLGGYFDTSTSFDGMTSITISYSSDKDLFLALPMTGVTDETGTAHRVTLLAGDNVVKVVALADFAQPAWIDPVTELLPLDLTKVTAVGFESTLNETNDANSVVLSLTSIVVDGISWGDDISPVGDRVSKSNFTNVVTGYSNGAVKLVVPVSGTYKVSVLGANGRVLETKNVSLVEGLSSRVSLSSSPKGVFFVKVEGKTLTVTEKLTLK